MLMNSVQNSDSEQCTESKLGQVHNVHTHGLGCEHAARWAGRVVAHRAPCGGLPLSYRGLPLGRVARCAVLYVVARPCALLCVVSQASSFV